MFPVLSQRLKTQKKVHCQQFTSREERCAAPTKALLFSVIPLRAEHFTGRHRRALSLQTEPSGCSGRGGSRTKAARCRSAQLQFSLQAPPAHRRAHPLMLSTSSSPAEEPPTRPTCAHTAVSPALISRMPNALRLPTALPAYRFIYKSSRELPASSQESERQPGSHGIVPHSMSRATAGLCSAVLGPAEDADVLLTQ